MRYAAHQEAELGRARPRASGPISSSAPRRLRLSRGADRGHPPAADHGRRRLVFRAPALARRASRSGEGVGEGSRDPTLHACAARRAGIDPGAPDRRRVEGTGPATPPPRPRRNARWQCATRQHQSRRGNKISPEYRPRTLRRRRTLRPRSTCSDPLDVGSSLSRSALARFRLRAAGRRCRRA